VLRGLRLHWTGAFGDTVDPHSALAGGRPKCAKWTNEKRLRACILLFLPAGRISQATCFA
jgi:hypothetical protein